MARSQGKHSSKCDGHGAETGQGGLARRNEAIARAWARGASYHGLGKEHGLTPSRVRAIILRRPDFAVIEGERERQNQAELDRLADMYREGLSLTEIGRRIGVGISAVSYRLRKHPEWGKLRAGREAARIAFSERVVRMYLRGDRIVDIGRRLGVKYQRVQWILYEHPEWAIMKRSHWTRSNSPERHARIRELHAKEWRARDIAREVGCSTTTVYQVIKRAARRS